VSQTASIRKKASGASVRAERLITIWKSFRAIRAAAAIPAGGFTHRRRDHQASGTVKLPSSSDGRNGAHF